MDSFMAFVRGGLVIGEVGLSLLIQVGKLVIPQSVLLSIIMVRVRHQSRNILKEHHIQILIPTIHAHCPSRRFCLT